MSICLVAVTSLALTLKQPPAIDWLPSFGAALDQSAQNGKILMLSFYSDKWSVCKRLDQTTYQDPIVCQIAGKTNPVKLNADAEAADLSAKYGVTGYPTVLFVDKGGKVLGRIVGYLAAPEFRNMAALILDGHENRDRYLKRLKNNASDASAAEMLAAISAERGEIDEALKLLGSALQLDPKNAKGDLAKALNAVGDFYTQLPRPDWNAASSYYEKTRSVAKDQADLVHASEMLAQCYIFTEQSPKAIPVAARALALKTLDPEDRKDLESLLQSAKDEAKGHLDRA